MNARIEFLKNQIGKDKWQYDYPLMDWLKAKVIEVEEGEVKFQFIVESYMLNPIGILHGGITATMLDEVMGAASFTLGRPTGFATINMNVDYLKPAKAGDKVFGIGKVLRAGKTILHIESKIVDAEDRVLAKATANMIATSAKIPL